MTKTTIIPHYIRSLYIKEKPPEDSYLTELQVFAQEKEK